jgi:SAM-dependent methyltransferase
MSETKEWFEDWFSSPYYDLLYAHRDDSEAELFIDNFLSKFSFHPGSKFWDLACGKGRHARYLANKGFQVIGTDLSEPFIQHAQQHQHKDLTFIRQDMREDPPGTDFDCVLNLFTAFGYFKDREEDLKVLRQVHKSLKSGGRFILDYLNPSFIIRQMVPSENFSRHNLGIEIQRRIESNRIIKEIHIQEGDKIHQYLESVQCLYPQDFKNLFQACELEIHEVWGDYQCRPFSEESSPRQIWVCSKSM